MEQLVDDGMGVGFSRDERAGQKFISAMRRYVLNDVAGYMRQVYDQKIEPDFEQTNGRPPTDDTEVRHAMAPDTMYQFYGGMRRSVQKMIWRSVIPGVERSLADLLERVQDQDRHKGKNASGTLDLDTNFLVPDYVAGIDVHMMPGSYHTQYCDNDLSMGAVFENGLAVLTMGFMGERFEDIANSISLFLSKRAPSFHPKMVVDIGCAVGHSTLPWAQIYPDAELHGVDVAAPVLRYAHTRARSLGVTAHFHQQSAETLHMPDQSVDLVYSSMLLHELPKKALGRALAEMYRVLKPGGLMLHYELPPAELKSPYENFYLNWDSYYNNEPFYKAFREMDARALCLEAGFDDDAFFRWVVPSLNFHGEEVLLRAAGKRSDADATGPVGQLVNGVSWFCFGAWK